MDHEHTAFHQLAASFGLSDVMFGVWICAIAIAVIVGVGFVCIELCSAPVPEGEQKR